MHPLISQKQPLSYAGFFANHLNESTKFNGPFDSSYFCFKNFRAAFLFQESPPICPAQHSKNEMTAAPCEASLDRSCRDHVPKAPLSPTSSAQRSSSSAKPHVKLISTRNSPPKSASAPAGDQTHGYEHHKRRLSIQNVVQKAIQLGT